MSDVLVTICGVTCACGGVFLIIGFIGFRLFGQSFVFSALALVAPLWNLVSGAGRKNTPQNRAEKFLDERRKQKHDDPSQTPYDAQAQAQNLDFDAQVQQALRDKQVNDTAFTAQSGVPTDLSGNNPSSTTTPSANTPQSQFGKSRFGARFNDNNPGRTLRDKRRKRNSDPTSFPDASYADLSEEAGVDTNAPPQIDNPIGNDSPPSRSLRDRRRRGSSGGGRRERNDRDDEIFGGMLDDDGDGFSDF